MIKIMKNFDVNYIVNEEKGIVVCTISNCEANAIALVDSTTDAFSVPCGIPEIFFMNNQYKGVAKCMPEDTFDVEYGKKLSRKRLVTKYNRMRYLFFKEFDKYIASCHSITSAKRDKYFLASEGDYHD